jgi:hypothetical protein
MAFPRKPWTFADDAELKELAERCVDRREIARQLNRSIAAVEVRASALGIKIASTSAAAKLDPNVKKWPTPFQPPTIDFAAPSHQRMAVLREAQLMAPDFWTG